MGRTYNSVVVNAPVDQVWAKLRNFHDLSWASAVIEDLKVVGDQKSDQIGAQRLLNGAFAETLVSLDDREHQLSYSIDDGQGTPVAKESVSNYLGAVHAHAITSGNQTFLEWESNWEGNEETATEFCNGIYVALLTSMQKSFE